MKKWEHNFFHTSFKQDWDTSDQASAIMSMACFLLKYSEFFHSGVIFATGHQKKFSKGNKP
jgi:hypothetical protein